MNKSKRWVGIISLVTSAIPRPVMICCRVRQERFCRSLTTTTAGAPPSRWASQPHDQTLRPGARYPYRHNIALPQQPGREVLCFAREDNSAAVRRRGNPEGRLRCVPTGAATLIRVAAGSMQAGQDAPAFADFCFDTPISRISSPTIGFPWAFPLHTAWEHVQHARPAVPNILVINPMMPDGEISVLEVSNDNMPFLVDSTMAELAELGI